MSYKHLQTQLAQAEEANSVGDLAVAKELARQILQQANILPQGYDKDEVTVRALLELSVSLWRTGAAKEALEHAMESLAIAKRISNKELISKSLNTVGTIYNILGDYDQALEFYQQALAINEELGKRVGVASNLGNIGSAYYLLGDLNRALLYYQQALEIDNELGNQKGEAVDTGNVANVFRDLGDFARSLEYYQKALAINEARNNRTGVAANIGNIATVFVALGDYTNALEYLQKALALNEEIGDRTYQSANINNIGNVYHHIGEYDSALKYYYQALDLNEEIGNKQYMAVNCGAIGLVYDDLGDYPRALEYFKKALEIDEELENRVGIALQTGYIGSVYANCAFAGYDAAKAEEYLLKTVSELAEIGMKGRYKFEKFLSDLYKLERRWEDAYEHLAIHNSLKDEVQSEEANKEAVQMEQQKLVAQREKEIAIAKAAADARHIATSGLLHHVLPQSIATRILEGEEEIADYFPTVSILFADIKGFTIISSEMPAFIVVRFLKFVFGEFDRIMQKHGCEKIKTIGDGYMAVAGAPISCEDHAERITKAAFEMQETIHLPDEIREHFPEGTKFGIRIGIHTGPVVAGVVGTDRFIYDIYSDAVNLASRMESHGEVNKIHVSADFARHLQNRFMMTKNTTHGIECVKRGEMEIKGKGMMKTYFLERLDGNG